ncbi:B9 domain-containing protein 1 [Physocladia obscura]|uniref:B9 domain-containing protein 1 n=1 Tax=Physocladia obscura TaxID=109957 RepID=A0AAD5SPH0_9FUNG|nr:B9 domain-containing protein 1 [Physocladia obscura]
MTFFSVSAVGQIESALVVLNGLEDGLTQMARTSTTATFSQSMYASGTFSRACVWNFPIEISFKSTNAFGWPQLVVCVYGLDDFGRDVIRGYGAIRLPMTPGRHTLYIPTVVPIATSPFHEILSWYTGRLPEYLDHNFIAQGKGREVTRVKSQGALKIVVDVATKNMEIFGFQVSSRK